MRRIVVLIAIGAFLAWRRKQFDACDRTNGYGAYADVRHQRRT